MLAVRKRSAEAEVVIGEEGGEKARAGG